MHRVDCYFSLDASWPNWTCRTFKVHYVFVRNGSEDSNTRKLHSHELFNGRPAELTFRRADKANVLLIEADERIVGLALQVLSANTTFRATYALL